MDCIKCHQALPDFAAFCPFCGFSVSGEKSAVQKRRTPKRRGNGQGSVYKVGKTWTAAKTFGYKRDTDGRSIPIRSVKKGFSTKTAALEYLAAMQPPQSSETRRNSIDTATVKQIYDLWLPTHEARGKTKSTIGCYTAAIKHFKEIWDIPFKEMGIDDWQECIDDCVRGRRTKENMRSLTSLLYQYAIPRHGTTDGLNLSEYLFVTGEKGRRHPFTAEELEIIRKHIGKVDYADYIYCNCYLGYRPSEFIGRSIEEHYNAAEGCIYGGIKTKAGQTRTVTISPKITKLVVDIVGDRKSGAIFCRHDGKAFNIKQYREVFYAALKQMGIESSENHKLTPYSCRHTFASMADRVTGNDNAKLELMGHTDVTMLRHYQHADLDALRRVTDAL